ncbi:UNVERIFIED_CONTAM: hypothetical protein FKN15_064266 [Acipenser sinensis]
MLEFMSTEKQFRYQRERARERERGEREGLLEFMSTEKQFSEDRIRNGIKKIRKSRQGSTQGRLDNFFKVTGTLPSLKRKVTQPQP